jgi:arabinogalactan endo-1,4-beta-galactosidase
LAFNTFFVSLQTVFYKKMMTKRLNILLCLLVVACGGALAQGTFWLGADISGTTALEAHGGQLYNSTGEPRENTQLMKEL